MKYEITNGTLFACTPDKQDSWSISGEGLPVKLSTQEIEIIIPDGVRKISRSAFDNISSYVRKITFPEGLLAVNQGALTRCYALEEVILQNGIERIMLGRFSSLKSLKRIVLPETVEVIDEYAFRRNSQLEEVVVKGNNLKVIGRRAFWECPKLHYLTYDGDITKVSNIADITYIDERKRIMHGLNCFNNEIELACKRSSDVISLYTTKKKIREPWVLPDEKYELVVPFGFEGFMPPVTPDEALGQYCAYRVRASDKHIPLVCLSSTDYSVTYV